MSLSETKLYLWCPKRLILGLAMFASCQIHVNAKYCIFIQSSDIDESISCTLRIIQLSNSFTIVLIGSIIICCLRCFDYLLFVLISFVLFLA